ncbi:MAG: hypothetical protein QN122_13490 [Armatimonadota bacterium]|nr:hypothetical protein [Armatimonadota bacterium]
MAEPEQDLLQNFVRLEPGESKRLHFVDHAIAPRDIRDPVTGLVRPVRTLVFIVDMEDGVPVQKTFSVTASRLAAEFAPFLTDRLYRAFDFVITKHGSGFGTTYTVVRVPRSA